MKNVAARKTKPSGGINGFPQRLQALRKQKNLSQGELGQMVGIHFTHLSRYERGQAMPAAGALKRLADVLGVSTDYLIEGTTQEAAKANFSDRELLHQFQEVEQLPDDDKIVIKKLLDAFLCKKKLQQLAR